MFWKHKVAIKILKGTKYLHHKEITHVKQRAKYIVSRKQGKLW